jgi:integrase/recombinase XerD
VRIRIAQLKEKAFIPMGYSAAPENWDKRHALPKSSHPHYRALAKKISDYLEDLDFEVKSAEKSGRYLTCVELKTKVMRSNDLLRPKANQLKILEYFDQVINELEESGRAGYADTFKNTRSTVSKLLNDGKHIRPADRDKEKDKAFLAFTKEDHLLYERLVTANDLSESTISHYLRNYYRIWNLAIKDGHCSREQHHP